MTHTRQMAEYEGVLGESKPTEYLCPACKTPMTVQEWESSDGGWVDFKYTCPGCRKVVWVDGIDS